MWRASACCAGLGLAIASIVMAVPKDEKAEAIEEILPGANCGACGYSGCAGYAKAVIQRRGSSRGLCSPGRRRGGRGYCASFSASPPCEVEYKTALVHCMGSHDNTTDRMKYQGISSCAAAVQLYGGISSCSFGCMGLGDCAAVCEYDAIKVCNGVASIDPTRCKGCSKCVQACPKHLISFVPLKPQAVVRCSNCDKGGVTRKLCKVGCIGCMKCVKVCESGAVTVNQFKASVDPAKCTACGKCVEVCPQDCIRMCLEGITIQS